MIEIKIDSNRIYSVIKDIENEIVDTQRNVSKDIKNSVVTRTPVDTGRARGNWRTGLNEINDFVNWKRFDPFFVLWLPDFLSATKNLKLGDTIYISNYLDYIYKLNRGSSKQAPERYVESEVFSVLSLYR